MLIGINIGGTTTTTILGDATGAIVARRGFATATTQASDAMVDALVRDIAALREGAAVQSTASAFRWAARSMPPAAC